MVCILSIETQYYQAIERLLEGRRENYTDVIVLLIKNLVKIKMCKMQDILGADDIWSVLSSEGFYVPNNEIDDARQLVDLVNKFEVPDSPFYASKDIDLELLKSSLDKLLIISSFVDQLKISDIENKTTDFKLRESISNKLVDDYKRFKNQSMYNNFNNLTNGNIVDIFYSEISQNLKNRNDAEKFVFYCLAKMYVAYSFDEYTRHLIDNCGISIGKFLLYANDHTKNTANILINTLLLECGSRSNKLLGVIALRMITSEVMLKYDIGNSRYIYDMVNNPDNMMKYL